MPGAQSAAGLFIPVYFQDTGKVPAHGDLNSCIISRYPCKHKRKPWMKSLLSRMAGNIYAQSGGYTQVSKQAYGCCVL